MVNNREAEIDLLFHALSDSTRRSILSRLAQEELNVTELAEPYEMSLAAVSKHLKVLEEARVVEKTKSGRTYRCRANLEPLDRVTEILEELGHYWRERLDALESFLQNEDTKKGEAKWQSKPKQSRRKK